MCPWSQENEQLGVHIYLCRIHPRYHALAQMQLELLINAQRPYAVVSIPNYINQTGLAAANGSVSFFIKGQNRGVIPPTTSRINYCPENAGM